MTAFILGIVLVSISFANTPPEEKSKGEVKIAVVEFSPSPTFAVNPDARMMIQTNIASALAKTAKFDFADVRWTRNESKNNLKEINTGSTAAAVKLGKKLEVNYVLTGIIVEYTSKDADGYSRITFETRLVEVSTGKIIYAGETTHKSTETMKSTSNAEMQGKALKPAIEKLKTELMELKF